ncbi:MAG: alpha/beta hydrolase [Cellvibrionaceae bacterium]|nr:alpha/beta hydrolase [Cellvibrionaceae bacterium]
MSKAAPSPEQMQLIKTMAAGVKPERAPLLKTPSDYGMAYEDVFFSALDGVPLEAWFIPAESSDKLIIVNHPMTMNRYGFPGHLEPWSQFNDVTVDFNNVYKALHDASYNVLSYDLRNHGRSGSAHGGVSAVGLNEWRDVIGALNYVKSNVKLSGMKIGLLNHCAGGNAAMIAMSKHPEYFTDVKAFICPQPASMDIAMEVIMSEAGLGDFMDDLDLEQIKLGGYSNKEMSPHPYAPHVKVPTLIIQVREDSWSQTDKDAQVTFDNLNGIESEHKKLHWIEGTSKRFDGYNFCGEQPELMLQWFEKYMT